MPKLTLVVNGEERSLEVEDRTLLVHALRDGLGLTGAHIGCDTTQCGACTPGVVMAAEWIRAHPDLLASHSIRDLMAGNLCRCTGYDGIVEAIERAVADGGPRG